MTAPLVVTDAVKAFGAVKAVAGASFDVRRGELLGLLGPNGAGKTTLIKAIAGRVKLDAGSIELFGRALVHQDKRPEIGVVPQELAVYKLHTARENLQVFGSLYGVTGARLAERVGWALAWSGLEDRANEPVARFSGGMKRRLNIACSLLHEPTLVLLDEPTVGVDPQSRERIYEMLAVLQAAGVSMVLTTHHLEEAERRCERLVIIDHGKTVAAGTPRDLMATTLGATRTLTLKLSDNREIKRPVTDLNVDVAAALREVASAGGEVIDIAVTGASLQDVFISLTGRELRE